LVALRGGLEGLMQDPEDGIIIRPSLLTYIMYVFARILLNIWWRLTGAA